MGNTYSYQYGCNDGNCPSTNCQNLFLSTTEPFETMTIIRAGGIFPIPQLEAYFNSCAGVGSDGILPCPTSMNEQSQSCLYPCPTDESFLIDPENLEEGKLCQNNLYAQYLTSDSMALAITLQHLSTMARIADLVNGDETIAEQMWPYFYTFYNNSYGKQDVDLFIKKYQDAGTPLPQAAIDALQNNFTDEMQRLYGILNGHDWANSKWTVTLPVTGHQTTTANPNLLMQYIDYSSPQNILELFKKTYRRLTINESNFVNYQYGNPFWTQPEWQDAFRRACGSVYPANAPDMKNGKDWIDVWAQAYVDAGLIGGGGSADHYFDPKQHPGMTNPYQGQDGGQYDGYLPHLEDVQFAGDLIHRETVDTTTHAYKNKCDSKSVIEELLPIGCAVVGGGVTAMIMPGVIAKTFAFGIGGYSCYTVVSSVYGAQALQWWHTTRRNDGEKSAALVISIGLPATFIFGMVELGYIPAAIDTFAKKGALVGVSGGLGYFLLNPGLETALIDGGDIAETILAPIGLVDSFFHNIFDGCDGHTSNSKLECYCENANSKVLLSEALVEDLYGTTDQQSHLRLECMHAATTQGTWGSDPVSMGTCNSDGWMDSPTACISAGEFAYKQWDPSLNPKAQNMWDEVKHCVAANNPSMLPGTLQDAPCMKKYGPYARAGAVVLPGSTLPRFDFGTDGNPNYGDPSKCYDFRAPPANNELGVASSYDWTKVDQPPAEQCTIL